MDRLFGSIKDQKEAAANIYQEYLYILCEFVEHSFETIGSKRHRLSNKMYKYSRFRLMRQLHADFLSIITVFVKFQQLLYQFLTDFQF